MVAVAAHLEIAQRLIELHEGLRLDVYDDATGEPLRPGMTLKGHPTIGYGRALDVKGITEDEADHLLRADLMTAMMVARDFANPVWDRLEPARRAVLIDMAHNLGRAGLFRFIRFREALQIGDWLAAGREMLNSKWAKQVGARAQRLAQIMDLGREW